MSGHAVPVVRPDVSVASEEATRKSGEVSVRGTIGVAARVAGSMTIAVCAVALIVSAAFAAPARRWLAYPFTGIPARPSEAATIFLHNLRALVAVGGLLLIAQSRYWAARTNEGRLHLAIQHAGEALLVAGIAVNVLLVGASLGAYDERMIRAILPHGPVELAAYSLALGLYFQGRAGQLPARHVLVVSGLSISVLALASALETFVTV